MNAFDNVIVFLGPSLPHVRAWSILNADYRAPAQMGDIYRVIASGVHTIVLIDGIFHAAAAVWQREILEAMGAGIRVIGASSMGALRAAELHTFGMIGVGRVFEWYRDRVIDGDDEVAIMHADASHEYRALSEPLVNIRYRLEHAVSRGVLTDGQARALTDHAKQTYFAERSNYYLLETPLVRSWSEHTRMRLEEILGDERFALKTRDALLCLEWTRDALLGHGGAVAAAPAAPIAAPSRFYLAISKRKRGFSHPDGFQVTGEMLWSALEKTPTKLTAYRRQAAKNAYLWRLATHLQVNVPENFQKEFRDTWESRQGIEDTLVWRATNGLTGDEYEALFAKRVAIAWMLECGPSLLDVERVTTESSTSWDHDVTEISLDQESGALTSREIGFLAAWARIRGITCPPEIFARLSGKTPRADDTRPPSEYDRDRVLCEWMLHMQPYHFGYTSWSPIVAVLEELQVTGQAAQLVREHWGSDA